MKSLADFLAAKHSLFDYKGFENMQMVAAQDIQTGIEFLHSKDIVHIDFKLANILVSNQHYLHMPADEVLRK